MEKKKIFYLIVALQVVFLLGMIAMKQSTIVFGTKVILKTVPYDPVEFFRGDYINIRYAISTINPDMVKSDSKDFFTGETVFVTLQKGNDYWKAVEISKKKPEGVYIKGIISNVGTKNEYTIRDANGSKQYKYEEFAYSGDFPMMRSGSYSIGDQVQFSVLNERVQFMTLCQQGCPYNSDEYNQYHVGNIINIKKGLKELSISYPIESYYVPKGEGNLPQFRGGEMEVEVALWKGDAVATNILLDSKPIDFR